MDALARLIGWKLSLHGVPVLGQTTLISAGGADNRYRSGTPVLFNRVSGHRDGDATSCPGDALYRQLPDLRNRANGYAGPVNAITVAAASPSAGRARPTSRARCTSPTAPRRAAHAVDPVHDGRLGLDRGGDDVCAPDGSWATSAVLPASGHVRAVFAGDGARPQVISSQIAVSVVPALSLTSDRRRTPVGGTIGVSGTLSPAQPRVTLVLERLVGRPLGARVAAAARGAQRRVCDRVRLAHRGLYRVWIVSGGASA